MKQKTHSGQLWALFFAFNGECVNQVGFWSSGFFWSVQAGFAPQSEFAPSSQVAFWAHSSLEAEHSSLEAEHSSLEAEHSDSALAEVLLT